MEFGKMQRNEAIEVRNFTRLTAVSRNARARRRRWKIYEAMATAKAVVSTTVGAEGLDVHHGRDIMLADDSHSFAQAVIMLLRDRELRRRYERAAAETAARCDWPAIGERFQEVLHSVVARKNAKMGAIPARTA